MLARYVAPKGMVGTHLIEGSLPPRRSALLRQNVVSGWTSCVGLVVAVHSFMSAIVLRLARSAEHR